MQNHEEELRIPKNFVDKYWKGISNPVVLSLPNGAQQKIFWVKCGGNIWFQKNWEKFAKFLKVGYAVVFKYIGGSYFKVKIFGVNTLEIDYSNIKFIEDEICEGREVVEVNDDSDKSHEIFVEVSDESDTPTQTQRTKNGKRKMNVDFDATQQKILCTNKGDMVKKAKDRPLTETVNERANRENPWFQLKLSPCYAHGTFMKIPSEFSREYLNKFKGTATISVGRDVAMKVKMKFDNIYRRSIITTGWNLFNQRYNLQANDICYFEMTQLQPPSFSITIFRAIENSSPKKLQGYKKGIFSCDNNSAKGKGNVEGTSRSSQKIHVLENSEDHNVVKPKTFKLLVNDSYPNIPNEFFNRHIDCHGKFVEIKVDEKSWFVKVNYYPRGSRFCSGWRKFMEDCKLENGDTCVFELIDDKKFVFVVSIVRKKEKPSGI
ncbi:B3 domain-containing transcription factor VRN1-like [Trifolium pratense]|uniref:B3 domain-containing transcription factor VRN1-like n=1 Tax=Trifolium pratense TaxID=57577 RepID=UPI001E694713|nr:B3 domain-containing transcription factor VRN1-like [Trifolium pratense]